MKAIKTHHYSIFSITLLLLFNINNISAQQGPAPKPDWNKAAGKGPNVIPTGVPMLLIAPDSRAGALGDLGAASTPDVNSTHWNNAKFAFLEDDFGIGLSYSPWMQSFVGDMNLAYLSGFGKITKTSAIAFSLTYFDLGSIDFYGDGADQFRGSYKPYEMAVDATYTMKLMDKLSAAVSGRFIYSDLTQGQDVGTLETHPGSAGAADIGLYWTDEVRKSGRGAVSDEYAVGLSITNLGTKISYSDEYDQDYLPANLRLGGRYTFRFDKYNELSTMLDLNKLLVPTPTITYDSVGNVTSRTQPDVSAMKGLIESFSDAPGGFKEEMEEINFSVGLEYWYNKTFAVRAGYYYQSPNKGDQQYFTIGGGLRYNVFGLDVSYLIPVTQNNPLQNTIRFSLFVNFKKS